MKRIIILTLIAVCAFSSAEAQKTPFKQKMKYAWNDTKQFVKSLDQHVTPTGEHNQWDVYVMPKIGFDATTLTGSGGDLHVGLTFGANFEVFVFPQLAVDFEYTYSNQGTNNVPYVNAEGLPRERDFTLKYLNTYYLCRWYPIKEKPLSIYSGIRASRLISAHATRDDGSTFGIKDDMRDGDVSIPIGASYEWKQWQLDLRYDWSFLHVDRSKKAKEYLGGACNTYLALSIGYKIFVF